MPSDSAGVQLGETVTLERGSTYKSALLGQPGPVLLGLASIQRNGGFRRDSLRTYGGASPTRMLLHPGDLYVSLKDVTQSADLLGAVARVPSDVPVGRLTQDTVKLVPTGHGYPLDLLYWVLRSPQYRSYCRERATGTTNLGLDRNDFLAYKLPEPTSERRFLVELLEAIEAREELLMVTGATLGSLAQALFRSWFVDFDPVRANAEGRESAGMDADTAALFSHEFEESVLGLIPKGWRIEEIGNVVRCVGGATPSTKEPSFWDGEHHWATPKDLSGLQSPVLIATGRKLTDAGLARISSGLLPEGTLLMSSRAPVGYLAIAAVPTAVNQGFVAMPPGGQLPPSYLLFWAKANMEVIKQKANGSTFMEISKAAFRPIKLCVPPAPVIAAFTSVVAPLLDRMVTNERLRMQLAELRDTLLPRLISGKLRAPEARQELAEAVA